MSNAAPYNFTDTWKDLAPDWMTDGDAEKYMFALQLCSDILLDKAVQAAKIGMPGVGDYSNLPWLAEDRLLVQGPLESSAAFALRLQQSMSAWKHAGSAPAILGQLQAYLQGEQPGVAAVLPEMTIVGGNSTWTKWYTQYQGDAIGAPPVLRTVPANWNWDGKNQPWRAWLILFMSLVATGQTGNAAVAVSAAGSTWGTGANVNGVWVPNSTSQTNLYAITITGIPGASVGQWITFSGSALGGNNGTFQVIQVPSTNSVVVANPNGGGVAGDMSWTIYEYPFIGPGLPWGTPGYVWGQGELYPPPVDTGSLVGGIWEPSGELVPGTGPFASWGLTCSAQTIVSIRQILARWKRANTYYPDIIVAFDGGTGLPGGAYSALSAEGSGNPDGTFGGRGKNVNGVWVPNRQVTSPYDAFCQGTGTWPGGASEVS